MLRELINMATGKKKAPKKAAKKTNLRFCFQQQESVGISKGCAQKSRG
jgi:hypothetical protein